jgi:L-ascorbate metabolism protein UlaG (beta-lactamase superfamily)
LTDTNKRLWGGFVLEANNNRILFEGDSGYDERNYTELAEVFGTFDYAILGIGAYEPAWFMRANHQSPEDALKAFTKLNASRFIPMHYGTFDLSDEPLSQPLKRLAAEAKRRNVTSSLDILVIGKPLLITD